MSLRFLARLVSRALPSLSVVGFAFALPLAAHADPASPYKLSVTAPPDVQVGKAGKAEIALTPSAGMHVNTEYPTAMTLAVPEGVDVTPAGPKIKPSHIEKSGARFDVSITAKQAGDKTFTATVNFVVCNDANTQCDPRREQVKFTVHAK